MPLGQLIPACFIKRENRFRAEIEIEGMRYKAHVPNSGRMTELLADGAKVWVQAAHDPNRKTPYSLILVEYQNRLVCLNAHMANDILSFWLKNQLLSPFADAKDIRREYGWGKSRFDFMVTLNNQKCLIEVKSVNLVINREARFPDAPTTRGLKHIKELITYQKQGGCSWIVFIVMGGEADYFTANRDTDPQFAQGLADAREAGVGILVGKCRIDLEGISFEGLIPYHQI